MFNILGKFLQKIIDLCGMALDFLISVLPDSPFTIVANSQFADLIARINFFLPIYEFVAIIQTWLVAVGIFYLYMVFARWAKAIE